MPSIKKNFLYSSFLTTANYIFPLLTLPYVSRILGVNNIGIVNFVDGIINYFIILSTMGIGTLGIREIAQAKNNKALITQTFSSLLCINAIFTMVALMALLIAALCVPKIYEHGDMMFLGGFKLVFNLFLIEWVYKGLEDFKFITIRTLIVKCLYVVSVFLLVRKENDYNIYYLLTVLMVGINSTINTFHARHFVYFKIKSVNINRYIKPVVTLGFYLILTSMYTSFNVVYLGFVSDDTQVGYYSTATKFHTAVIAIFTAFTGVMMPRMSALIKENRIDEFKKMFARSVDGLLSLSIPVIIFAIALSSQLVLLIAGEGYEGAVLPMAIVMPLFFIIGYEQILVIQVLIPLGKDDILLKNSIIGAVIGLLLNVLLVGRLQAVGSAMVWVISELTILVLSQVAVSHFVFQHFPVKPLVKSLVIFMPMISLGWLAPSLHMNNVMQLAICALIGFAYFTIIQIFVFRNGILMTYLKKYTHTI